MELPPDHQLRPGGCDRHLTHLLRDQRAQGRGPRRLRMDVRRADADIPRRPDDWRYAQPGQLDQPVRSGKNPAKAAAPLWPSLDGVLLTYVDESYTRDMYFVAALLCPGREAISLTGALDMVVAEAHTAHGVAPQAELHGHDLFQGKGDWALLAKMPRARIGVYNQAFRAIGDHDVKIIICGVNSRWLRTVPDLRSSWRAGPAQTPPTGRRNIVGEERGFALVITAKYPFEASTRC